MEIFYKFMDFYKSFLSSFCDKVTFSLNSWIFQKIKDSLFFYKCQFYKHMILYVELFRNYNPIIIICRVFS